MEPKSKELFYWVISIVAIIVGVWLIILTRNSMKTFNYIGRSAEQKNTMFVTGMGKATAIPDIAKIDLGILTRAATVADAQSQNTNKINKITSLLKNDFKIESKDIQTSNYSIYPEYNWTNGKSEINGYAVNETLSVKIRSLDKISAIIQKSGEIGLNQVGSLNFDIDKRDEVLAKARTEAIQKAKEKAESIASAADIKLGRILSINESNQGGVQPYPYYAKMDGIGIGGEMGAPSPSIETGSNEITVNVTIEYELL